VLLRDERRLDDHHMVELEALGVARNEQGDAVERARLRERRLEERAAPIRIEKTGRGRFRLVIDAPLQLDAVTTPG